MRSDENCLDSRSDAIQVLSWRSNVERVVGLMLASDQRVPEGSKMIASDASRNQLQRSRWSHLSARIWALCGEYCKKAGPNLDSAGSSYCCSGSFEQATSAARSIWPRPRTGEAEVYAARVKVSDQTESTDFGDNSSGCKRGQLSDTCERWHARRQSWKSLIKSRTQVPGSPCSDRGVCRDAGGVGGVVSMALPLRKKVDTVDFPLWTDRDCAPTRSLGTW